MPLFLVDDSGKDLLGADQSFWRQNMPKDLQFINIALINNMPDLALKDTERQFTQLLEAAAQNFCVRLTILSLPGAQRSEWAQRYVEETYGDLAGLWSGRFDGIIVTGAEPREKKLSDEPYWPALTKIIDWSRTNSISSVWSCLAAHAAVYYMDSVERHALPKKQSGVFEFSLATCHPIMSGVSSPVRIPHSRYNELRPDELTSCGYTVVTQSASAGVDTFVKRGGHWMVFFQGHPEYEAGTLLREYRRDIGRFLRREREAHPLVPDGYFDALSLDQLTAFRDRAIADRREELIADFPSEKVEQSLMAPWRQAAVQVYHNWLISIVNEFSGSRRAQLSQVANGATRSAQKERPHRGGPSETIQSIFGSIAAAPNEGRDP